jgi:hypothetical protein
MKYYEGIDEVLNQKLIADTATLAGRDPIDKLTPIENTKIISTTGDARQEDLDAIIIQQNILYTVATLTAATFLITSIILSNGQ